MSPDLATFLFELVNFALLAGGLGWLFFRPVRKALDAEVRRVPNLTHPDAPPGASAIECAPADQAIERAAASGESAEPCVYLVFLGPHGGGGR